MSYLSENLADLMNKHGLNATTLARATGVPQPTIHRILRGATKDPHTDTVKPLADLFGVSIDALRSNYLDAAVFRKHAPLGAVGPVNRWRGAGMSQRGYFAAKAMPVLLASDLAKPVDQQMGREWVAKESLRMADAMLVADVASVVTK